MWKRKVATVTLVSFAAYLGAYVLISRVASHQTTDPAGQKWIWLGAPFVTTSRTVDVESPLGEEMNYSAIAVCRTVFFPLWRADQEFLGTRFVFFKRGYSRSEAFDHAFGDE